MTNILDTVEPDGFGADFPDGTEFPMLVRDMTYANALSRCGWNIRRFYFRETVESLLEAHRKQVLLEAAEEFGKRWTQAGMVQKELRRMAEGEK
jgi:hypothetical protein